MIKSYSDCLWVSKVPITTTARWQITRIRRDIAAVPFIPYFLSPLRHFKMDSLLSTKFALHWLWSIERTQTGRRFPQENSLSTRGLCQLYSCVVSAPCPSPLSRNRMKQNAILLQIFLWYKIHYLVCSGVVNWSMWFIVIASSWIRQLRFGHLPLQHALVKGQGLSYSLLQESHGERHPLSVWQMTSQKRITVCRPCIGLSQRSDWAVTSLENMTRCSHGVRFAVLDFFASEDGKTKLRASIPQLLTGKPIIISFLFSCLGFHSNESQILFPACCL